MSEIATTDTVTRSIGNTWNAVRLVLGLSPYRRLALTIFIPTLTLYAFALPATYTGGTIGLVSLRYLNLELVLISLAMAAALSVALTLNAYAYRVAADRRSCSVTAGALVSSILPASVCCTPVVPTLLAFLGASTPQIFAFAGQVQGFFATWEMLILALALALMVFAIHLAAKSISPACAPPAESRTGDDLIKCKGSGRRALNLANRHSES